MASGDERWRRRYRRRNKGKIDPSLSPEKKAELRRFGWRDAFRISGVWGRFEMIATLMLAVAGIAAGLYLKGHVFISYLERLAN